MTLQIASDFLLRCTALNYAVLFAWFVAFSVGYAWMRGLHGSYIALRMLESHAG